MIEEHSMTDKQDDKLSNIDEQIPDQGAVEDEAETDEQWQAEITDYKDRLLRSYAELDNIKRRAERDVANAHKFSIEKIAKDLLPVIDSFEMALKNESEGGSLFEGIELTHKMLLDTLAKHQIKPVDPEGELFDPELHEALSMQEAENIESNTVISVMQKGYTLHQRLLRPALVIVAK